MTSIYEAISFAIASVFWLGVIAAVVAFVGVLVIRELLLRTSFGPLPARPAADPAAVAAEHATALADGSALAAGSAPAPAARAAE